MIKYGPYIVVKNLKTREFKEKIVKKECLKCRSLWTSNRYCPDCGSKISTKFVEKTVKRKPFFGEDFLKRNTLYLLERKVHGKEILVPNKKWEKDFAFEKYASDEWVVEIPPIDAEDIRFEIKGFEHSFSKELKELRENYESVEVKFGLVNCNY